MRKDRCNGDWYSNTHRVTHKPPLIIDYGDREIYKLHTTFEESPEKILYSKGIYKTKIKKEDLPPWFMPIYRSYPNGYIYVNIKKISDIIYHPNIWVNHLFKDDFLYLKFSGKLEWTIDPFNQTQKRVDSWDLLMWGWDLVQTIAWVEVFGEFDVTKIKEDIESKVLLYAEQNPDEHDCISLEEYRKDYNEYKEEARKLAIRS